MIENTNVLIVRFENKIYHDEIEYLRGAIIHSMEDAPVLFHNHQEENKFRYNYPLIQYKRIGGNAAIVCISQGAETIGCFFNNQSFDMKLNKRKVRLELCDMQAKKIRIQIWDEMFEYTIRKWMPLNQENYRKYQSLEGLAEKYVFLEKLLTANILSFAKGLGVFFEKQVEIKITDIYEQQSYRFKGVPVVCFDLSFKTNVSLPDYIGLGKGVSLGYGMINSKNKKS